MLGMLSFTYSSMLQSVEHQALSTVLLNFERFLQPLIVARRFPTVLSACILAIFLIWCSNDKERQMIWCRYLMDNADLQQLHLQALEFKAEIQSLKEKSETFESEIRIRLQSLLDDNECLSSRVDPFSASGDSLADWIGR